MGPVRVLYFGRAADIAGVREVRVAVTKCSVGALLDELGRRYSGIRGLRRFSRVAVNGELVDEEFELHGGETVALLPPVAGG